MTKQQALKNAAKRWGTQAAVQVVPLGGRIGEHGEFVKASSVTTRATSPIDEEARYTCRSCSTTEVWHRHRAGGPCTAYKVGLSHGFVFEIRGEGGSWEEALADADVNTLPVIGGLGQPAPPCHR